MTTYADEVNVYNPDAIGDAIDDAALTADNYLTDITGGGVFVHPSGDSTSGWKIASALELIKGGLTYIKAWLNGSTPTVRLGQDSGSHVDITSFGMEARDFGNSCYFNVEDLRQTEIDEDAYGNPVFGFVARDRFVVNDETTTSTIFHLSATFSEFGKVDVYGPGSSSPTSYLDLWYIDRNSAFSQGQLKLSTVPESGTVFEVFYWSSDSRAKALRFGRSANSSSGLMSSAFGPLCDATGPYSTAFGYSSEAKGFSAHAEGYSTANGYVSHAEGGSTANGEWSHSEGGGYDGSPPPVADGIYSHAENTGTLASGYASHAEGHCSEGGRFPDGQGGYIIRSGGDPTTASGFASHAEGVWTIALGKASHSQNEGTVAASDNQTALGKYNVPDANDTYVAIIGNGTSDSARSNALAVTWGGDVECGKVNGVDVTSTGTAISNPLTAKSIPHNGWTSAGSVTLEAGTWVVTYGGQFDNNASGLRGILLNTTNTVTRYAVTIPAASGSATRENGVLVLSPASQTTYNLYAYQSSGNALNFTGYIQAVRLK